LTKLSFTQQDQRRVGNQKILDIVDFSRLIEIAPEKWQPFFRNAKDMRMVIGLWNSAVRRSFPGADIVRAVEIEMSGSRWHNNEGRYVPSIENYFNRDMALQTLRSHVFCNYRKTSLEEREAKRRAEEAAYRKRVEEYQRSLAEEKELLEKAARGEVVLDDDSPTVRVATKYEPPPPPPPPPIDPEEVKQLIAAFSEVYYIKPLDRRTIETFLLEFKESDCLPMRVKAIFDQCMASEAWQAQPARKPSWQSFLLLIRDTLATPNPEKHICPQYDVVYRITASVMEAAQKATEEAQAAEAAQAETPDATAHAMPSQAPLRRCW
jgi:hypothetical protein